MRHLIILLLFTLIFLGCGSENQSNALMDYIAPGWKATVVAEIDQSYAGWDVEIGDADNDGKNDLGSWCCLNRLVHVLYRI